MNDFLHCTFTAKTTWLKWPQVHGEEGPTKARGMPMLMVYARGSGEECASLTLYVYIVAGRRTKVCLIFVLWWFLDSDMVILHASSLCAQWVCYSEGDLVAWFSLIYLYWTTKSLANYQSWWSRVILREVEKAILNCIVSDAAYWRSHKNWELRKSKNWSIDLMQGVWLQG